MSQRHKLSVSACCCCCCRPRRILFRIESENIYHLLFLLSFCSAQENSCIPSLSCCSRLCVNEYTSLIKHCLILLIQPAVCCMF